MFVYVLNIWYLEKWVQQKSQKMYRNHPPTEWSHAQEEDKRLVSTTDLGAPKVRWNRMESRVFFFNTLGMGMDDAVYRTWVLRYFCLYLYIFVYVIVEYIYIYIYTHVLTWTLYRLQHNIYIYHIST